MLDKRPSATAAKTIATGRGVKVLGLLLVIASVGGAVLIKQNLSNWTGTEAALLTVVHGLGFGAVVYSIGVAICAVGYLTDALGALAEK